MNTRRCLLLSCFFPALLTTRSAADNADNPEKRIVVEAVGRGFPRGSQRKEAVHHYFGGQKIDLPLTVKGESTEPVDLRARLVQLSFSLAAPFDEVVEISSEYALDDSAKREHTVSLTLPEVKSEALFELRFEVKSKSQEEWRHAGGTRITIYSRNILEPLKPWSERVDLRLKDDGGALRGILTAHEVTFTDHRSPVLQRDIPVVTLVVNDSEEDLLPERELRRRETLIVLNERVKTLPKVVASPSGEGIFISVDLEIIEHLETDPRAQEAFLEIIRLSTSSP